jgi:glucose-6-phosphate isomerase
MADAPTPLDELPEWAALKTHLAAVEGRHLRELLVEPGRLDALTMDVGRIHADLSKHRVTPETIRLLAALAERRGLRERIDAVFAGEHVNTTEDRAVMHVCLPEGPVAATCLV